MTTDDRPLSDEASLGERYPRKSQPATDDPLRDVWAHIFNSITATNITRPDGTRWLFSTRLDASERVWGVVEPLLRTDETTKAAVAATFRYITEWGLAYERETAAKAADDFRHIADEIDNLDPERDVCCPVCQEVTCDDHCPLAPVRNGGQP